MFDLDELSRADAALEALRGEAPRPDAAAPQRLHMPAPEARRCPFQDRRHEQAA